MGSQLPLRSDLAKITTWINQQQKKVIAIDLPTGIASDEGCVDEYAVRAEYTISLHGFKPSAFLFHLPNFMEKRFQWISGFLKPAGGRFGLKGM